MRSRRCGLKAAPLPKIFSSGLKRTLGAAPVLDGAQVLQLALRLAARERHGVELLAARHLHLELLGQRVDDRHADAVQAAGGVVDLAVELAARVQRGHDHFERGLVLELGVRVDRDAAAVVGDGEIAVRLQLHVDPGGVAGHRLVHGVVDHLGEQVMQRLLVGAADVHAGPAPHRLEAFQHLDVGGGVAVGGFGRLANGTRHGSCLLLLAVPRVRVALDGCSSCSVAARRDELQACLGFRRGDRSLGALGAVRLCRTDRARPEKLPWT